MYHTLLLILQLRICLLPDPMPLGTLVILKMIKMWKNKNQNQKERYQESWVFSYSFKSKAELLLFLSTLLYVSVTPQTSCFEKNFKKRRSRKKAVATLFSVFPQIY